MCVLYGIYNMKKKVEFFGDYLLLNTKLESIKILHVSYYFQSKTLKQVLFCSFCKL